MPLTPGQSAIVRQQIAQILGIDPSRITPEANFFTDLGGTPEHLRPLRLGLEQALGISIDIIVAGINALIQTDQDGWLSAESVDRLHGYLPDWPAPVRAAPSLLSALTPGPPALFLRLFTVSLIEAIAAKALAEKAETALPVNLAPEHAAKVRQLVARQAEVPLEQLTPATNLVRDLGMDGPTLGMTLALIRFELDSDILSVLQEVQARFQTDEEGRLTPASHERITRLLPGLELDTVRPTSFDDLFTVGMIETMAARAVAQRPADLPWEPITSQKSQQWVRQLPEELGPRKLRLLLAAACRYSFQPRGKLEPEVADAFELLEKVADGLEPATSLKKFRGAFRDDWWQGQRLVPRAPEYHALYDALRPDDPQEALTNVVAAIQRTHNLSPTGAFREIHRMHADLAAAPVDASAWRTPAVVELARSMYQARHFREMSRLADALQQAGCAAENLLDHCRDPKAVHVRGCWLIDAILDGSWAESPKPATPKQKQKQEPKPKSLLSQLPKRQQYRVREQLDQPGGSLSLVEYLASRWDFETLFRSHGLEDQHIADWIEAWLRLRPNWTRDQARTAACLSSACDNWGHFALARRIDREDPSELARGHSLSCRQAWLELALVCLRQPGGRPGLNPWGLVSAMAVRDLELARRIVHDAPRVPTADEDPFASPVLALFHRDLDRLRSSLALFTEKLATRYKHAGWVLACLRGAASHDPQQVAQGLGQRLDETRRRRTADRETIDLQVHGLYRLCQWSSPDLVAGFDVTQGLPWDAQLHAWVDEHDSPLADLDLSAISPVLHDALIRFELPGWFAPTSRPEPPAPEPAPASDEPGPAEPMDIVKMAENRQDSACWEKVFVRHVDEKSRGNIQNVESSVQASFPSGATVTSDSGSDSRRVPLPKRPSGRWLLALRLEGMAWIALFSNAGAAEDVFRASAKSRRLEAIWVGYDSAKRGWFFVLSRAGKRAVEFSLPASHADQLAKARLKSTDLEPDFLDGCASGDDALRRLCRRFDLDPFALQLAFTPTAFQLLDAQGKPSAQNLRGYFLKDGPALSAGDHPASDALAEALERRDPEAIRAAAAQGARLDALPDSSISPLIHALLDCPKPRWRECVMALVELGCPVDGLPGDEPPVIASVEHWLDEDCSLEMLELLVSLGANVNATNPGTGDPALLIPIVYARTRLIRFLLDHGADPTIENQQGVSPIVWLQRRIRETYDPAERQRCEDILNMVTGHSPR